MTEKLQIYKCDICGNVVQVLLPGNGNLVCCGEEMKLLEIQHDEVSELGEKHNPIIQKNETETFINVNKHPMTSEHYIQFIQAQSKDKNEIYLKYFYPNERPEINITRFSKDVNAIEYCNIHQLWGNI